MKAPQNKPFVARKAVSRRPRTGAFSQAGTRRRGAAIVEFALVVPVVLAILIGILESAWLAKVYLTVANATREGARSASLGKPTATVRTRIKNAATPLTIADGNITLVYSTDNGATFPYSVGDSGTQNSAPGGSMVRVTVQVTHQSLTRFFPFLNNRIIAVPVTMRREAS
jgi:Flp pilus assembly protein TadG